MNRLIKRTFENRGYTDEYIQEINNYSHDVLKDSDVLCQKLKNIHDEKKHLVIIPDFDMDGIMSGVCNFTGFAELGFVVSLFIPDPSDGYGFTKKTVKRLFKEYPTVEAVITCDVGITCYEGIDALKTLGVEVLITDHHLQEKALNADVVVDPNRLDETYSHPGICGAYVAYQILQQYADTYCDVYMQEQISRLRVFAGIGTISDMMPLLYENRKLVLDSVDICRLVYSDGDDFFVNAITGCDTYRRAFYGLFVTLNAFADAGKITDSDSIDEQFFAYYLAPTFNCLKRMNKDMANAFGIFFDADPSEKANNLIMWNDERKTLEQEYMQRILSVAQPYAPYIYFTDAPAGFVGLIANKLMLVSGVPTLVVSQDGDGFSGSGRSPKWYPFVEKVLPEGYHVAGHNAAFGVGFTDKRELDSYYAFIVKDVDEVAKNLPEEREVFDFVIAQDGTGDVGIDLFLFADYLQEIKKYRPFGQEFPAPNILLKFIPDECEWSLIGKAKQHIKIKLNYGFELLLWNQAQYQNMASSNEPMYVSGNLNVSKFNDVTTINFIGTVIDNE